MDIVSDGLVNLQDLQSLSLHCFVHPPSDAMLAIEQGFVLQFGEKLVNLSEVSFSPLCAWQKSAGVWVAYGDGIQSGPVITAFTNRCDVVVTFTILQFILCQLASKLSKAADLGIQTTQPTFSEVAE